MKKIWLFLAAGVLIGAGTISLSVAAGGENENATSRATIYVPDDHGTIQAAVDNASAGDTIIVRDGTLYENININKQITLQSENGTANCTIDGGGSGDTPYAIPGGDNQDGHPLIHPPLPMHLCQGWNLVTIPSTFTHTACSLGENISDCSIVAYWNATLGYFQPYLVGISPPAMDFTVHTGVGYFLYLACNSTCHVIETPEPSVSVALSLGWNTIGWYNMTATNASGLGTAIDNCTIVAYWNASSSTFASYLVGISPPAMDFAIERGMGVFVYVTKPGVWHGEG